MRRRPTFPAVLGMLVALIVAVPVVEGLTNLREGTMVSLAGLTVPILAVAAASDSKRHRRVAFTLAVASALGPDRRAGNHLDHQGSADCHSHRPHWLLPSAPSTRGNDCSGSKRPASAWRCRDLEQSGWNLTSFAHCERRRHTKS